MVITSVLLLLLFLMMTNGYSENETRTVVFMALVLSNILLTFTGRSETESILKTIRYKNMLIPVMALATLSLLIAIVYWSPAAEVFGFMNPLAYHWIAAGTAAIIAVLWIEIYKSLKREQTPH
jgi:Ca2+-transporting ATPase